MPLASAPPPYGILPAVILFAALAVALVMTSCGSAPVERTVFLPSTPHPVPGALAGRTVAILADSGVEQTELLEPRRALDAAGARTVLVSPKPDSIIAWDRSGWGVRVGTDVPLERARAQDYDALLLPGGVMNPDRLRMNPAAVHFVQAFAMAGKPIAAICHGPWMLVEADAVRGHRLTSWPSLRTDLQNAGASWVDAPVVVDGNLVTSRKPEDIPDFDRQMIAAFATAGHAATLAGARDR
jgi:protease I